MKLKKKICVSCGYETYIFSKGRCKPCTAKDSFKKNLDKRRDVVKKNLDKLKGKVTMGGKPISNHTLEVMKANQKFYREAWDSAPHICSECNKPLGEKFNAGFVSHILSRGSSPEHAHNLMNQLLLCLPHHREYETGDRKKMKIWPHCEKIILLLKNEYADKNKFHTVHSDSL